MLQDGSNPIKTLLSELGTRTLVVTNKYLDYICTLCADAGLALPSDIYAIHLLKFLEEQGCITIIVGDSKVEITGLFTYSELNPG